MGEHFNKAEGSRTKPGRPPKLTDEIQDEIVELLRAGNYIETACAVAGVSKKTFYEWMKKANQSKRKTRYTEFRNAVKKAQAWSEARDVTIIAKHGEKSWQAAAWRLERKYPDRWGRKDKLDVESKVKIDSDNDLKKDDELVIKEALDIAARKTGRIGDDDGEADPEAKG